MNEIRELDIVRKKDGSPFISNNPYKCGEWQNRISDSFTEWKKEWMHRGDCSAPDGEVCPYCDSRKNLIKFQKY